MAHPRDRARWSDSRLLAGIAAEVFSAAMQAAPRYVTHGESAAGWLVGIARNVLGHSLRRGQVDSRARKRLGLAPLALEDADLERVLALADAGRGPATRLLAELGARTRGGAHLASTPRRLMRRATTAGFAAVAVAVAVSLATAFPASASERLAAPPTMAAPHVRA
jgi:DNA-directed RNA polymerase specialized sigma24 family protein